MCVRAGACAYAHVQRRELILFCRKLGGVDQGDSHLEVLVSLGSCTHLGTVDREGVAMIVHVVGWD